MHKFVLFLFVAAGTLIAVGARLDGANQDEGAASERSQAGFRLPKFLDFTQFMKNFHKSYSSHQEEMVRQKIYLGRAFRAFVSAVQYRYSGSGYYLAVNNFSDQTLDERRAMSIPLKAIREDTPSEPKSSTATERPPNGGAQDWSEQLPVAEPADLERELAFIKEHADEPEYKVLAQELLSSKGRSKRSTKAERALSVEDLVLGKAANLADNERAAAKARRKFRARVASNNPLYEMPELASSASGQEESSDTHPLSDAVMGAVMMLPGANYLGSVVNQFLWMWRGEADLKAGSDKADNEKKELPDEVFVDLRDTGCFSPARSQKLCGSCYAFTAIALYEYLHCRQTGLLVPFSEQLMVDCGHMSELQGCDGGRLTKSAEFVEQFGLELRNNYPYMAKQDNCPYESVLDRYKMGFVKVSQPKQVKIGLKHLEQALKEGWPSMMAVTLTPDFHDYGGGVHHSLKCPTEDSHAMLIMGHGRENNMEYFMLRNSHSHLWGEAGYYKINKEDLYNCAANNWALTSAVRFKPLGKKARKALEEHMTAAKSAE